MKPSISCCSQIVRAFFLLLFVVGFSAWAQHIGYTGKLPITASIDTMQDELYLGKPEQREDLLQRLGVNAADAHAAAMTVENPAVRWTKLKGTGSSLLFLSCDDPRAQSAQLLLMQPAKQQAWRVVDRKSFSCWWQKVAFEPLSIAGQDGDAVLVHHANEGHGSGYVQDDMVVLGARGGRFITLLKTQEYKSEEMTGTGAAIEQKSTLQPFPDGSIEETRATTLRQTTEKPNTEGERVRLISVERRRWQWNKTSQSFVATGFAGVKP